MKKIVDTTFEYDMDDIMMLVQNDLKTRFNITSRPAELVWRGVGLDRLQVMALTWTKKETW